MNKWDERYAGDGYLYGTEPNTFLRENFLVIPKGKVLLPAEGEGRNAVFLAEAYTPEQLKYKTGGPPVRELLVSLNDLKQELQGLRFLHAVETLREVQEGMLHAGKGAVVQVIAVKD